MPIKIKFIDQEFQIRACESVVKLFEGFSNSVTGIQLFDDEIMPNVAKHYEFNEDWLFENLVNVQRANRITEQITLDAEDGMELEGISNDSWRFPVFTTEMETGTGKTYVYLRTIRELNKNYGFKKFIVIVPSIAIYEGVKNSFKITSDHFKLKYGNDSVNLIEYDGSKIARVKDFATSTFITIMIMTIDSFNSLKNVIYKPTEKIPGEKKPYQYIQDTRSILILDEPQNYQSEKSKAALRTLRPLFALSYSATPKTKPNLIYYLSPVDAFKMNLVKKIQVLGVTEQENINAIGSTLELESVIRTDKGFIAKVKALVDKDGVFTEKLVDLRKKGDDLYEKTKNIKYKGFIVEEINKKENFVSFVNSVKIKVHDEQKDGIAKKEIFRIQIESTIKKHFEAQKKLIKKGIKVLSLFFIDRVSNYVDDNGMIKQLFDESFEKIKKKDEYFSKFKAQDVREAYFAKRKQKDGTDEAVDIHIIDEKKTKEEKELEKKAYELIMQEKEVLLGFDEKICFIFAHSALKEGWDNPNVFQICTLNHTVSDDKKRQEIGRGLRLCVNIHGDRVMDDDTNILTVIANESYESYVTTLQSEYVQSGDVTPPPPSNARKAITRRNNQVFNNKEFRSFWNRLCQKTDYNITVETENLVKKCIDELNHAQFPEPKIVISQGKYVITTFKLKLKKVSGVKAELDISIADTDGNIDNTTRKFEVGNDLSRTQKDERLRGFKIVDIVDDGKDSKVVFGNDKELDLYNDISFDSEKGQGIAQQTEHETQTNYPVFNIIDRAGKELSITRKTIFAIFKGMEERQKKHIFRNPEGFSAVFISIIREQLANHIAEKIEYSLTEEYEKYDLDDVFPEEKPYPQKEIISGSDSSMYNEVQYDSDVELKFIQNRLNTDDKVICYFKFPPIFKINIPKIIGNYNPDWGVIRTDDEGKFKLQLVRETKGNINPNLLQFPNERRKIECAEKHFEAASIDYRQITEDTPEWWKKASKSFKLF